MEELRKLIETKSPLRGVERVRWEMSSKAQTVADKYFPDDPEKNKVCADAYLLAMFDMIELIYN